ncbi:MAG: SDR family NAD(P)-dependent oxidoreductase, partial [Anaerolineae bacterium]|nr:SDR family NAD(P)-dependent oxidoreductase [Anaerolineae bacterium]
MPFVLVMVGLYTATRFGSGKQVTDEVEQLLDRPPITMRQFVHDYADAWQKSRPSS